MKFDEEDTDDEGFDINYDNVIECKECLNVTRLLAADLKSNPSSCIITTIASPPRWQEKHHKY